MMKRNILIGSLLVSLLVFSTPTIAHESGETSYFTINGKYTNVYPLHSDSSLTDFVLPEDIAPETYSVNRPITFAIDSDVLKEKIPQNVLGPLKFIWDFGDNTTGAGLTNTHTYKKVGSYILIITLDTSTTEQIIPPQVVQTVLFHVVPNAGFDLPRVKILVNGQDVKQNEQTGTAQNVFPVNFTTPIHLEVVTAAGTVSNLVSYYWDLDDGDSSKEMAVNHQYNSMRDYAFPVVRVTDDNGFIIDASVELSNDQSANSVSSGKAMQTSKIFLVVIFILGIGTLITVKKFRTKKIKYPR